MTDGTQQGIEAERALKTILGGRPAPAEEEERTPAFWLARLEAKDDDIGGYEAHAEVIAKYIVKAYRQIPGLVHAPNDSVYFRDEHGETDWDSPKILVRGLSDCLKDVYTDEQHPFRRALSQATAFSWGWAFNIARYSLGLPPQPNPAIITIGG